MCLLVHTGVISSAGSALRLATRTVVQQGWLPAYQLVRGPRLHGCARQPGRAGCQRTSATIPVPAPMREVRATAANPLGQAERRLVMQVGVLAVA